MQPIFCMCNARPGFDFEDLCLAKTVICQHLVISEVRKDMLGRLADAFQQCPGRAFLADSVTLIVTPGENNEVLCDIAEAYKRISATFGEGKDFSLVDSCSDRVLSTYQNSQELLPQKLGEFLLKQCKETVKNWP